MSRRRTIKKRARDEGEKPFWISFSDLMSVSMAMFLVVMAVALLAVTSSKDQDKPDKPEAATQAPIGVEHQKNVDEWVSQLEDRLTQNFPRIQYRKNRNIIDFGSQAHFKFGKSEFEGTPSEVKEKEAALREFVPTLLALANGELGKKVVKRVVVEGYADRRGTYLSNLDLSLRRSERVLCALLDDTGAGQLSDIKKKQVRELFLVGGYSFNNEKSSDDESRRIEMRIEFLKDQETRRKTPDHDVVFGRCPL